MLAADPIAITTIINGNIQQRNIHNSTIEVIPQQVQPTVQQFCELLLLLFRRVLVVVVLVVLVVVKVGVDIGALVATTADDDDRSGCDGGGCSGGFPVE